MGISDWSSDVCSSDLSEKAQRCIQEFGYDAAIDYQGEDVADRVATLCPDGVDVYFDNTAGPISDAVLPHLAMRGRVVVCGTASISRWDEWPTGPRVERPLLVKRDRKSVGEGTSVSVRVNHGGCGVLH